MIRIDWDEQLEAVRRRLEICAGGVLHVRSSTDAAASTFMKTLRRCLPEWTQTRWAIVTVSPRDQATHYLTGIVAQIYASILGDPSELGGSQFGNVTVGENIKSLKGDVTISDVEIQLHSGPYESLLREHGAANSLPEAVEGFLANGGHLCIAFTGSQHHDMQELRRFRDVVWDDKLELLCDRGVLLVDESTGPFRPSEAWPPHPDLVVDLPSRFADTAREQAARDLAVLARNRFPQLDEGQFARTALAGARSVAELHAWVANVIAQGGEL